MTRNILEEAMETLRKDGYIFIKNAGRIELNPIMQELGEVIYVTDVKINVKSRSLVASSRALDFHTDHPRADYVAWLCIKQSDSGGETIIADAEAAYLCMLPEDRKILGTIRFFEHKVFRDDEDDHPMIVVYNGKRKFYYSYWLSDPNISEEKENVLNRFHTALHKCTITETRLDPDDVLIIDNTRILHGRRSFVGRSRFLKRYWIRRYPPVTCCHRRMNHAAAL